MLFYRKYTTLIIVLVAVVASGLIYLAVAAVTESIGLRTSRLTQIFALAAIGLLYLSVAIQPLQAIFPKWQKFSRIVIMRRGFILATTYFAALHIVLGFFGQLGGFNGLAFLNDRYLIAISFGFLSFIILILIILAGQFQKFISKMISVGYIVAVLILVHALMLGNHFANILEFIPQLFFTALALLLIVHAVWWDKLVRQKYALVLHFGPLTALALVIVSVGMTLLFVTPAQVSLNVHNDHGLSTTTINVAMPAAPATNEVVKVFQDYQVTLRKPGTDRILHIDLNRLGTSNPDPVGQATLVLVDQATYGTLTLNANADETSKPGLSFAFSLENPQVSSGVYKIYAKFYLATGVLLADFSVDL